MAQPRRSRRLQPQEEVMRTMPVIGHGQAGGTTPATEPAIAEAGEGHGSEEVEWCLQLGLDKILAARQLTRLVDGSARFDSARFKFFTS